MRLPFLILTPACVLLGLGTAVWTAGTVSIPLAVLAFVGALCAHISVNAFNEYFDFKSGLDLTTKRTPFSGGSGTLPGNPAVAHLALRIAWITFAITGLIGVYFLYIRGLYLLPIGLLGLLIIFAYTPWLTHNALLCLIAPGLGFGPLMVMGTDFVLTGAYSQTAFIASLVPFFLVNNLLLLNQFPDVEADRGIGRKHFPIIVGTRISAFVYGAFLLFTYLSVSRRCSLELFTQLQFVRAPHHNYCHTRLCRCSPLCRECKQAHSLHGPERGDKHRDSGAGCCRVVYWVIL